MVQVLSIILNMNRKRKGSTSSSLSKRFFKNSKSTTFHQTEQSTLDVSSCASREWQRCGEGFTSINGRETQSNSVKSRELSKSFAQKWIQPEALLVSSQPVKSCTVPETDSSNQKTVSVETVSEICWSSSDSESIECPVTNKTSITKLHTQKQQTSRVKKKTPRRERSAKCVKNIAEVDSEDSGSDQIVLESDSDSNQPEKTADKPLSQDAREPSTLQDIECVGSPVQQQPEVAESSDSDYDVQWKEEVNRGHLPSPGFVKVAEGGTPSISSCASSQTPQDSDVSPGTSGLRASEWAKQVQWETTPTKQQITSPAKDQADSGKKKKKYKRGGLADQLSRIIAREKSASRMWVHQQLTPEGASRGTSAKCVTVKVMKVDHQCSLHIAHCSIQDSYGDTGITGSQCLAVFSRGASHIPVSRIQPGSIVKIFPPWQQLDVQDGKGKMLLCTLYQLVDCPPSEDKDGKQQSPQIKKEPETSTHLHGLFGHWRCPCSADAQMMADACPAYLFPVVPACLVQSSSEAQPTSTSSGKTLFTVTCGERVPKRILTFDTLLESIEKSHTGDKLLPSFQATVLRVFRERTEDSDDFRYMLLVEDTQGTVALVTSVDDSLVEGGQDLEGQRCCFSRLKVHSRTNRDKDPALFTAIEAAWCVNTKPASSQESGNVQHSDDSLVHSQRTFQPPAFCYILAANEAISEAFSEVQTIQRDQTQSGQPPHLALQTIASVLQSTHLSSRVSLIGKVICASHHTDEHSLSDPSSSENVLELFVVDHSLVEESCQPHQESQVHYGYIKVLVRPDCVTDGIKRSLDGTDARPSVLLLRDVRLISGRWIADKYSWLASLDDNTERVKAVVNRIDAARLENVQNCRLCLPALSASASVNSLVSITGVIKGVDEKSAFSWDECDGCGSDQLGTKCSTGTLVCMSCRKEVKSPVQRMKMDVFVACDANDSIKIGLQQSTIQKILPEEGDEEGYDVDCVLNKRLGPLSCVVTAVNQMEGSVQMIAKELAA